MVASSLCLGIRLEAPLPTAPAVDPSESATSPRAGRQGAGWGRGGPVWGGPEFPARAPLCNPRSDRDARIRAPFLLGAHVFPWRGSHPLGGGQVVRACEGGPWVPWFPTRRGWASRTRVDRWFPKRRALVLAPPVLPGGEPSEGACAACMLTGVQLPVVPGEHTLRVIIADSGGGGRCPLVTGLQGAERAALPGLPGPGVPGQHLPAGP